MVIEVPGVEQSRVNVTVVSNGPFITAALGELKQIHYLSRTGLADVTAPYIDHANPYDGAAQEPIYPVATVSQLIQATHQAFANHVPLTLSPEIMWYAICHEVATLIKSDPRKYARYFTDSPDAKKTLTVRDDSLVYGEQNDWLASINFIRDPLRRNIPAEALGLFLPKFSTLTPESETAILVAFMDTVSSFYEFGWQTDCGIPRVKLEGEVADWELLVRSTVILSEIFVALQGYFADLLSVLREIVKTAKGEGFNREFWNSIYKYDGGSGGPYVGGWITTLTAYLNTSQGPQLKRSFDWHSNKGISGYSTNVFPAHLSQVRFVWEYFGRKIPMAFIAGIMGREYQDGFIVPKLGVGVVELNT